MPGFAEAWISQLKCVWELSVMWDVQGKIAICNPSQLSSGCESESFHLELALFYCFQENFQNKSCVRIIPSEMLKQKRWLNGTLQSLRENIFLVLCLATSAVLNPATTSQFLVGVFLSSLCSNSLSRRAEGHHRGVVPGVHGQHVVDCLVLVSTHEEGQLTESLRIVPGMKWWDLCCVIFVLTNNMVFFRTIIELKLLFGKRDISKENNWAIFAYLPFDMVFHSILISQKWYNLGIYIDRTTQSQNW